MRVNTLLKYQGFFRAGSGIILLLFLAMNITGMPVSASNVNAELVAGGLHHPWSLAFLPDGSFLVTERRGRLYRIAPDGESRSQIDGLPAVATGGQGGLLDIVLHPDFDENSLVYFTYSEPRTGGSVTALARAVLVLQPSMGGRLESHEVIFRADPPLRTGQHFGSRIVFDRNLNVYVTLGDRGQMEQAQDTGNHWGSIVRLYDDGQIPEDNPFVDNADARNEIYTYGNRNPQGITMHPETGEIWSHEHGPRGGDELNLIAAGRNYGWPHISHGEHYRGGQVGVGTHAEGMEQPVAHWSPAIAPSGMAFYTGDRYPGWEGNLFIGSLVARHLRRLVLDGHSVIEQEVLLENQIGRIRDVRTGPDGYLYLITDEARGGIYRVRTE